MQAIVEAVKTQPNVLLQAATGAGKTIIFSHLVQAFITQYSRMRIVILAHREQLVRQAYDKLLSVWPEGEDKVSIACASVSSTPTDWTRPVIIGSVQTMISRYQDMPEINMLIVDECHRMPPKAPPKKVNSDGTVEDERKKSQYEVLIQLLRKMYPAMRLLGVTATPYRMGQGLIYREDDPRCWFQQMTYQIGIKDLQREGYLCPLVAYSVEEPDLSHVKRNPGGDFVQKDLAEEMSKDVHLGSAVKAFESRAQDRKHIVIFAVTIEHAELLQDTFERHGYTCAIIHSKMPAKERRAALDDFAAGKVRFIVNVGVLTEGWDCPETDCLLMCRPTESTALYVQMAGRGLRIAEGKTDCLMLDLAGNWARHGDPAEPTIRVKQISDEIICPMCFKENPKERYTCRYCGAFLHPSAPHPPVKCPECGTECTNRAIRCPECGTELKTICNNTPGMKRVGYENDGKPKIARVAGTPVVDCNYLSRKGNRMVRITMSCYIGDDTLPTAVPIYLDIAGEGSKYGQKKAREFWSAHSIMRTFPDTLEEAEELKQDLRFPKHVALKMENGYWEVAEWIYGNQNTI